MKEYKVTWTLAVFAENAEEAAFKADEARERSGLKAYEVTEVVLPVIVDLDELWKNPEEYDGFPEILD